MTNKTIFLLMGLIPLFFCAKNAQGMLFLKKKRQKPLGWKIKWPKKEEQFQELSSTYRQPINFVGAYSGDPTLFVGSVPRVSRGEQLRIFKSKLTLKKIGSFFYPGEFERTDRMCNMQRISTRSRMSELIGILRKTNRLNEIGPDQKASIKLLIENLSVKQLREHFKFLSDQKGNNLLFFAAKEDDPSLFGKMLLCAGSKKGLLCAMKQKNGFGTSVFDVLNKMEKNSREKFLNPLVK